MSKHGAGSPGPCPLFSFSLISILADTSPALLPVSLNSCHPCAFRIQVTPGQSWSSRLGWRGQSRGLVLRSRVL